MLENIPKTVFTKYAGKRIALVNGRVAAVSNNAVKSYKEAKKNIQMKKLLFSQYHVKKTSIF